MKWLSTSVSGRLMQTFQEPRDWLEASEANLFRPRAIGPWSDRRWCSIVLFVAGVPSVLLRGTMCNLRVNPAR
jgi:hypothetical protein